MKKYLTLTVVLMLFLNAFSQSRDTSYVYVDDLRFFSTTKDPKAHNDPDPRTYFPFNGGKTYDFNLENGIYNEQCYFTFLNWHMVDSVPYPGFEAHKVSIDTLKELNFKDAHWFQTHSFRVVVQELFANPPKVIYLIDGTEIEGDSTYMVRVRFRYPSEE